MSRSVEKRLAIQAAPQTLEEIIAQAPNEQSPTFELDKFIHEYQQWETLLRDYAARERLRRKELEGLLADMKVTFGSSDYTRRLTAWLERK